MTGRMLLSHRYCCVLMVVGVWLVSPPVQAEDKPAVPFQDVEFSEKTPVVLSADQMEYDDTLKMVVATGRVEVSQGQMILTADSLTYDQRNNLVFAEGSVSVLEPSGNVYFADSMQLSDDMTRGVVRQMQARMVDNSLFAANEAIRVNEDVTELKKAVYSPCRVTCDDGSHKAPLWQLRAKGAVIDQVQETVTYDDVYMDVYGVPVAYSPYFSHASPGASNKSGFLSPEYKNNANLGNVVRIPYYWAIAPDRDLTTTLLYSSEEAPVALGEYRQRFDEGRMKFDASLTRPDDFDALGRPASGNTLRGHVFGEGNFMMSDAWQWGFNVRRTLDDTYLRRYDINNDPLLTSRAYAEGFNLLPEARRSFVMAQGLAFQGLQQQDDSRRSPFVLPEVMALYESQPMEWNSRLTLGASVRSLTRDLGADSHRVSMNGQWMVPYVTEGGQVLEFATGLRVDGYDISNQSTSSGLYDGQQVRAVPDASLTWRYPLINRMEGASLLLEPVISAIISPYGGNSFKIPNEDSATPEFTDTNLFSGNRFPGYDRLEVGPRVNYGVRSQLQFADDSTVSALLGQTYRTDNDPLFPITNDLRSRTSDYVGRLGLSYQPLELNYRFRMDKDNFSLRRSEVDALLGFERMSFGANYLKLDRDPVIGSREEIIGSSSLRLTDYWTLLASAQQDMLLDAITSVNGGLVYQNECLTLRLMAGRNYTRDRDFQASTSVSFQVLLKNLN